MKPNSKVIVNGKFSKDFVENTVTEEYTSAPTFEIKNLYWLFIIFFPLPTAIDKFFFVCDLVKKNPIEKC